MTAALIVVEACAIALLGALVVGLLRDQREMRAMLSDLEAGGAMTGAAGVGVTTPSTGALVGSAPDGRALAVDLAGDGDHTLLAFLTSSCITCRGLWAELGGELRTALPPGTDVLIVTEDGADERAAAVRDLAPRGVPVLMSSVTWRRYGVTAAPFFALVEGATGRVVTEGTAANGAEVLALLQSGSGA